MKVYVVKTKRDKYLQLRWQHKGKWKQKSAGTNRLRDAERKAVHLERELADGEIMAQIGWESIRIRFWEEHVSKLKKRSRGSYDTALNRWEDFIEPRTNEDLTSESLVQFVELCRRNDLSPNTIANYVRHLTKFFRWLLENELIGKVPRATLPKAGREAKGRPLTEEEFERLLAAIHRYSEHPKEWAFDACILWHSGLRLDDAMKLSWDDKLTISIRGLERGQPMLWIPANEDKSGRETLLPLTPDFVSFLRQTWPDQRSGYVCHFLGDRGKRLTHNSVSKKFADFGRLAGIVSGRDHQGEPEYASAHDLRRSFGTRLALKVEAAVLQKMMRHQSIATTLTYYAHVNAHRMADVINKAYESEETKWVS